MKLYFAHPINDYNTLREIECLKIIQNHFPNATIVNPNEKIHSDKYLKEGMKYFESLAASCDILVAVPFLDGEWGMGVWKEAESAATKGKKVFELYNELKEINYQDIRPLSITETKKRVRNEDEIIQSLKRLNGKKARNTKNI